MHAKSLLLTFMLLGWLLPGLSPGQETRPVEVYARGDYAGVVELLEPIHQAGKANIQQRLILARAYLHVQRSDDALAVLKSVLAADKENPEANGLTGKILHDRGEHQEALEYLTHAYRLKQDPATASVLGRCYYALGDTTKAKVHLEKALAADIRNPGNSLVLGKICLARGLGALAEKYLLAAQEAGLDTPELHLLLGRAYLLQRKFVGPVRTRRLPAPAKPGDVVGQSVVIGKIEGVTGQYKVSTPYCALYEGYQLLKADPDSADAHYMLAACWLAAGELGLAEQHLQRLAAKEPASTQTARLGARLLLAKKDYAALHNALVAAEQAGTFRTPQVADFYYQAAVALRADGKGDQAVRMLTEAEKRTPASGRVLRSLATLHLATGSTEHAGRYYTRLVELFPDAEDIDELRNMQRVLGQKGGAR